MPTPSHQRPDDDDAPASHQVLVYDGECPFCKNYVSYLRLKTSLPELELRNAREPENRHLLNLLKSQGKEINDGMALVIDERVFHGAECIHVLSLLTSRSNLFNKFNYFIFKSKSRSSLLYPVLRGIRNLTLRVLGKPRI